jgi:hypothetical protein
VVGGDGGDRAGILASGEDEPAESYTGEVAHRRLIFIRVFHDFGTQITALDDPNILLVAFFIHGVFE